MPLVDSTDAAISVKWISSSTELIAVKNNCERDGCSTLEIAELLRRDHRYQEPISLQCNHIPELEPTWSLKKYKVSSAQRHGQDGWARGWITNGRRAPLRVRHQQGGGGVLVWAAIIKDELVGPFRVEDGLKINSQTYCQFLEDTFFKQWYRKKSAAFEKAMIFMQDNAPSHPSKFSTAWLASKGLKDDRLMT
ncbi:hypothetical protein SKAU_G00055780 [Synaphobranchus kaupii]|uniref:Transposase n=1 Tax=Synaphobranchus kaupii TaxID=118154 RepID=A0A9Q1G4S4_SYNKA|nr:hypothetical protein SKAU_G00055780 [Synaphobranchus kaupii]